MMELNDTFKPVYSPSVQERITAIHDQQHVHRMIQAYPQAGIYNRFNDVWAIIRSYTEGEIRERQINAEVFLRNKSQPGLGSEDEQQLGEKYRKAMDELVERCLLHRMSSFLRRMA